MTSLSTLVERGGIRYGLGGGTVSEVLRGLLDPVSERLCPADEREALVAAALERENLMSTGIGRGIAVPHPRSPVISDEGRQFVTVGFLKNGVGWKALDGKPVDTVFLIVSASAKIHLHTLSEVNFLCGDEKFYWMLERRASKEDILAAIREREARWGEI